MAAAAYTLLLLALFTIFGNAVINAENDVDLLDEVDLDLAEADDIGSSSWRRLDDLPMRSKSIGRKRSYVQPRMEPSYRINRLFSDPIKYGARRAVSVAVETNRQKVKSPSVRKAEEDKKRSNAKNKNEKVDSRKSSKKRRQGSASSASKKERKEDNKKRSEEVKPTERKSEDSVPKKRSEEEEGKRSENVSPSPSTRDGDVESPAKELRRGASAAASASSKGVSVAVSAD